MNSFRISSLHRNCGLILMSLYILVTAPLVLASSEEITPLNEMAERSNAIYVTEIVDIAYHTSQPNAQNDRAQPFTFVTFKVLKTLRGKSKRLLRCGF